MTPADLPILRHEVVSEMVARGLTLAVADALVISVAEMEIIMASVFARRCGTYIDRIRAGAD